MKIKYAFITGEKSEVEVDEKIGTFILNSRKKEKADDERHRYHNYSLNQIDYEGPEFGCCDSYEEEDPDEGVRNILNALNSLTEIQKSRMLRFIRGYSIEDIAREDGTSHQAVSLSISAARTKIRKKIDL